MEFLDLIESYTGGDTSTANLYRGEGHRARARRRTDPRYRQSLDEARSLIERVHRGDRYAALAFEEAMSTSDFPLLFGDILDRTIALAYNEYPNEIEKIVKRRDVRDFRSVSTHAVDGAESTLEEVGQGAPYPAAGLSEARDTWAVSKFGRRIPMLWETLVNDDLDAFRTLPGRLARAARRSEQKFITGLYIDSTGPHASLYSGGNANVVTSNPVLSEPALITAMTVLHTQTDEDSQPIYYDAIYLVVPPALEVTARKILNATEIRTTAVSGTELVSANWMNNRIQLIVDPYIPIVASSANGNTTWCLFGDPTDSRAALEFGKLRGHEEPEVWIKSPNAMRAGGGDVGPDQGDFESDSIEYRVRSVFGGTQLLQTGGFRATVGSEGDGS